MLGNVNKIFKARSSVYVAIITMLFFSVGGAFLTILGKEFPKNYQWLFINPSYTNNEKAGWIIGVWSSVLGIHGTIAALSITFMSMFATEASTSSKKRFESITRKFIFTKYKFLNFSMDAICGLLTGIFLLSIGGGAIQYSISISISLFFIVSYTKIYYRLYFLTENKNSVGKLLLGEFTSCGSNYREDIKARFIKNEEFSEKATALKCIKLSSPLPQIDGNEKEEFFIISSDNETLTNFNEKKLKRLDHILQSQIKNSPNKLFFDVDFNRQNNLIHAKFIYESDYQDNEIEKIKKMADQVFIFLCDKEDATNYHECVDAVVGHIFDGLLSGDITALEFGLECISNLSSSGEFESMLMKLDRLITTSGVEKSFQTHILANFYKRLLYCSLHDSNSNPRFFIFNSMLDLPFYIYDEQTYLNYFIKINDKLEYLSKYESHDTIDGYLSRYINATIKHMESRYYSVFEINTKFLTNREYLENNQDRDALSGHQTLLLNAAVYNITLLIMRLNFINAKSDNTKHIEEKEKIFSLLVEWLSAKFFKELYYLEDTYTQIFTISSRRELSNSVSKINEIPDGEVYGISNTPYYMAIITLLYTSYLWGNFLSLAFIRDIKKFHIATSITTHSIEEMIKITESEDLIIACIKLEALKKRKSEIDDSEELRQDVVQKTKKLKSELESIKSSISKIISDEVYQTKISDKLTETYTQEITTHFINNVNKIIDLDLCISSEIYEPVCYTRNLNKRELIEPIDGCFYSRNPEIHSMETVYSLIRKALGFLPKTGYTIEHLEDVDDSISKRLVTIEYMITDRSTSYRFIKGINIKDNDGALKLPEPGLYYMDIQADLNLQFNKKKPLTITFETIEQTSGQLKNSYEHLSTISIAANIIIEPKRKINLKFLSLQKCAELLKRKEDEYRSLISQHTNAEPNDKL